jgi:hypothetical protein
MSEEAMLKNRKYYASLVSKNPTNFFFGGASAGGGGVFVSDGTLGSDD